MPGRQTHESSQYAGQSSEGVILLPGEERGIMSETLRRSAAKALRAANEGEPLERSVFSRLSDLYTKGPGKQHQAEYFLRRLIRFADPDFQHAQNGLKQKLFPTRFVEEKTREVRGLRTAHHWLTKAEQGFQTGEPEARVLVERRTAEVLLSEETDALVKVADGRRADRFREEVVAATVEVFAGPEEICVDPLKSVQWLATAIEAANEGIKPGLREQLLNEAAQQAE